MAGLLGAHGAARPSLLAPVSRARPGSAEWYMSLLSSRAAPQSADTYEQGVFDEGDAQLLQSQIARGSEALPAPSAPAAPQSPAVGLLGAPQRRRVNPGRVLSRFIFGGEDPFQAADAERVRLDAEAARPQLLARQARIQSYVDTLPIDLQLAFSANPEELGKAFSTRAEGRVLDQGDVYLEGGRPAYAAPFEAAPGSSVFDPLNPTARIASAPSENKVVGGALVAPEGRVLYRGPQVEGVAATADAYVTPEIAEGVGGGAPRIVRAARPDSVTLAPGAESVQLNPDGSVSSRVVSSQTRPISDSDQRAIAEAEANIARINTSLARAQGLIGQLDSGELNLGPVTNLLSNARNWSGQSDQNSLNYEALLNWARTAREAILQSATGTQTEGDSVRALDLILSNPNDERVVRQGIARYVEAQTPILQTFERDIARRQGGQVGPAASSGGTVSVTSPAEAQALQPGTRYRTPDGQEYIR